MEKIITIDGRDVRFKATAALPLYYATHFDSDVLQDCLPLQEQPVKKNRVHNTIIMYRIIWTMAYCADKSIKPMEEWFEDFNNFPIYQIFAELNSMFWASTKGVAEKN
jgi:hypothetical protein